MNAVSADNWEPWTVSREERVTGLEVVLLKQTYVLPWSQFLYAEGGADEARLVFTTHDVVVTGAGLGELLVALRGQRLVAVREPARPERFARSAEQFIREIVVRRVEGSEDSAV